MENRDIFISDREISEATEALIGWFKSQGLRPVDVIPVCIKTLAVAFHSVEHVDIEKACDIVRIELKKCMQGKQ